MCGEGHLEKQCCTFYSLPNWVGDVLDPNKPHLSNNATNAPIHYVCQDFYSIPDVLAAQSGYSADPTYKPAIILDITNS